MSTWRCLYIAIADLGENNEGSIFSQRVDQKMAPFQIRKADANDGAAILDCLAAAFERYRNQYTAGAFADTVLDFESIQNRLREMCVFVALSEEKTIGTVGCSVHRAQGQEAEGHLRGMAVLPEWQGTRVASALLQTAEAELIKNGCTSVTLDTTEPLTRAIRFYERHGFSASGRISDFFGMRLYEYSKKLP
jgi:ribosomal protein S18 acetylase RimI-like enzyme